MREAAVVGMPNERWGEKPVAIVVLADRMTLSRSDLEQHCRARLADTKCQKHSSSVRNLPRNPSGKILKRMLREELETNK